MSLPFWNREDFLESVLDLVSTKLGVLAAEDEKSSAKEWKASERKLKEYHRRCQATLESGRALALEYLFSAFQCDPFEQHCIMLALCAELDARIENYYASVQEGKSSLPTLDLCLRCYSPDIRVQLDAQSHWQGRREMLGYLFEQGYDGSSSVGSLSVGLKLDSRVLEFILDYSQPDPDLDGIISESWEDNEELPALVVHQEKLMQLLQFSQGTTPDRPVLCCIQGAKGSGRRTLIKHWCQTMEVPLLTVDLTVLLQHPEPWNEMLVSVFREAKLRGAALAFLGTELLLQDEPMASADDEKPGAVKEWPGREHLRYLLRKAREMVGILFLLMECPWRPEMDTSDWHWAELELDTPDAEQRLKLWEFYTGHLPMDGDVSLDALANKFALEPGQIASAVVEAQRLQHWQRTESVSGAMLHQACRSRLPHNLNKLASRVNASYTWDDLILPPEQKQRLQAACNQVEFRRKVYEEWGFGKKVAYGRGVSMLFSGPPGTGKTMAAQVIANRLQLELYKVDLSSVMSKYVGETEKQLGQVFDEVKKSQSILFFDEADALFGKRSETKDSHDRYANVQTSFLLQKIEEYDGIVVLASNFLQNFDEAFKRRIKFIIDFTLPDEARREQIWRSVMPPELPRDDDVDYDFLARSFELSGSSIKNIAVAAAFMAASDGMPVNMAHLLLATQAEQHKAGKSMGRDEFGEYYYQVEDYRLVQCKGG